MTALPRRFDVVLTGDTLRLGTPKDAERCIVTLLSGAEADDAAAVKIYLPRDDRRAYARAARAFNKTMERYEQRRPPEQREIDPRHEALRAAVLTYHGQPADD